MEQELISIVIPCYNCSRTVARTLDSILYQTYKNLEIVVVNDGSKDNTLEILENYAKLDKRIKVVDQSNHGVSYARNNGIQHSTGTYQMFIDSDDNYTTPLAIENMMKALKDNNADVCVCRFSHPCFEMYLDSGVYDLTNHSDFLKYYEDFFSCSMIWNRLIKRECLTEPFANGIKLCEDELFNLDNLHNIKRVVVLDDYYYNYYCAPYIPLDNASAITSLIRDNLSSMYDLFNGNQELKEKTMEKNFPQLADEMRYISSFDFFFWSFFLMAKNRVNEDVMEDTFCSLFKNKLFLTSIKAKERYGLKAKKYTNQDIKDFCKIAYFAFRDIKLYNKKLSMYKVFLVLFCKYFLEAGKNLNTEDIVARVYSMMDKPKFAEGLYIRRVIKNRDRHHAKNDASYLTSNMTSWFGNTLWSGDGVKEN